MSSSARETFILITNVVRDEAALGDANAVIICYLRRQDNVLQSLYNQSVKGGGYYKDIGDFVFPHPLDYFELLGRWAAVFGKENIVVRPYEKQQFKDNDLISDFLSIVGLELTVDFARLAKNANPRLPLEALEYMRLLNSLLRDKKMSKAIKKRLILTVLNDSKTARLLCILNSRFLLRHRNVRFLRGMHRRTNGLHESIWGGQTACCSAIRKKTAFRHCRRGRLCPMKSSAISRAACVRVGKSGRLCSMPSGRMSVRLMSLPKMHMQGFRALSIDCNCLCVF
jgi:hypothetical protein